MPRLKSPPAVVEKHPDGWLVTYGTPNSEKKRQRIFRYEKAARKFALRQEVLLVEALARSRREEDEPDVGVAFDGGATELDGSSLSHWRDVMWRGFVLLAANPFNDDLERRLKACSTAFRAALPTLLKEELAFDSPEALEESRKAKESIAAMFAQVTAPGVQ